MFLKITFQKCLPVVMIALVLLLRKEMKIVEMKIMGVRWRKKWSSKREYLRRERRRRVDFCFYFFTFVNIKWKKDYFFYLFRFLSYLNKKLLFKKKNKKNNKFKMPIFSSVFYKDINKNYNIQQIYLWNCILNGYLIRNKYELIYLYI